MQCEVVTAPNENINNDKLSIFLAGGITDCPNWQKEIIQMFKNDGVILFNPRRDNFPIDDPNAANEQITWEHNYLRKADVILFWFPKETMCPIVLYELGTWSMSDKPIFVGMDSDYKRRQDVEIQTKLVRPEVKINYTIEDLYQSVKHNLEGVNMSDIKPSDMDNIIEAASKRAKKYKDLKIAEGILRAIYVQLNYALTYVGINQEATNSLLIDDVTEQIEKTKLELSKCLDSLYIITKGDDK